MSENLNKILGELEEDLQKLRSAREQVESVIESTQKFTEAANGMVKNSQSLIIATKTANVSVLKDFSEKLAESKEAIDKVVNDSISHLENQVKRIEGAIDDTSKLATASLEEQRNENLKTLNQILDTHNQIKQLFGQLLDLELPGTLKNINSNLEKLHDDSKQQFKMIKSTQMWMFVGVALLFVMIVAFKFVI